MAHYASFPGNLALSHNGLLIAQASNTLTPVSSSTPTQPYRIPRRRRRGRDAFAVFVDVYIAKHKHRLPTQKTKVRLIARSIWDRLPREEQLIYQKLAREEREDYERDNAAPALQRCVSARGSGSRNSRGCQMAAHSLSIVDRDLPHWPVAQGMDTQTFLYRAPTVAPTAAPEIPRVQYSTSSMMNGNTDAVLHDVYFTQGQGMIDTHPQ
ncbi:hypothetical protein EDD85DRAFT_841223 [Armillaria nabsnona]|nr:hypothetical protein EDD85DRAFT_841223 [Armillaria nabsnona]